MHVDLIAAHWLAGFMELYARIEPDDPRASWTGDYLFASTPHKEYECPFNGKDRIYVSSVEGLDFR